MPGKNKGSVPSLFVRRRGRGPSPSEALLEDHHVEGLPELPPDPPDSPAEGEPVLPVEPDAPPVPGGHPRDEARHAELPRPALEDAEEPGPGATAGKRRAEEVRDLPGGHEVREGVEGPEEAE